MSRDAESATLGADFEVLVDMGGFSMTGRPGASLPTLNPSRGPPRPSYSDSIDWVAAPGHAQALRTAGPPGASLPAPPPLLL
ncbi:hypothetical protein Rmf_15200 [Roseomonas fluvialis]|uniref:Uncharacterized protein n=1 Tax=Roseomonas fluvialis TaxID=1750527 RepID=A0ABM8I4S3_9PROT|nr:hypothetical protein Rmf_15200 [Roseomonas fluvialis]